MPLFFRKKSSSTVSLANESLKLLYQVGNVQGVGNRSRQEDSFTFVNALDEKKADEKGLMFAVCDGMGGMQDGREASLTAVASLRSSFAGLDITGDIGGQLRQSVIAASERVEEKLCGGGGSTAVVGVLLHEQLYFASVGDSFLFLYRNGSVYRLNRLQTVCSDLYLKALDSGITDPESCRSDPDAPALLQFLGMPGMSDVDYNRRPLRLNRGDVLIACSDGVGGVLTEEDIAEAAAWPDTQDKCQRIEAHIREHNVPEQDNYTALIISCI